MWVTISVLHTKEQLPWGWVTCPRLPRWQHSGARLIASVLHILPGGPLLLSFHLQAQRVRHACLGETHAATPKWLLAGFILHWSLYPLQMVTCSEQSLVQVHFGSYGLLIQMEFQDGLGAAGSPSCLAL